MKTFRLSVPGRPQRWVRPQQDSRRGKQRNARFTDPKARADKDAIAKMARAAFKGDPWTGPVVISFVAVFAIPSSWPKYLRESAMRGEVMHIADPDLDQLCKQMMDALKGIVFADDNQVCGFAMPFAKRYGHPERRDIVVTLLDQNERAVTPGQRRLEAKAWSGALG